MHTTSSWTNALDLADKPLKAPASNGKINIEHIVLISVDVVPYMYSLREPEVHLKLSLSLNSI